MSFLETFGSKLVVDFETKEVTLFKMKPPKRMNDFYRAKFKELFIEFTRYLTENPEFAAHIPENAEVVLLDSQDPDYSLEAIKVAGRIQTNDDIPKRPLVYIEVKEMAPVRSRLRKVKILESPPEYAMA